MPDSPRKLGLPLIFPDKRLPAAVTVYEVGARDGLQAEHRVVPTPDKIRFIRDLRKAGLPIVEATSFVSPRRVPQLADAEEVMAGLAPQLDEHPVLVPNLPGLERAVRCNAKVIAVFVSVTETFAQRNLGVGRAQALTTAVEVTRAARAEGLAVRGYVSMCFGDPWEGPVDPASVATVSRVLVDAGCYQVSIGDTIGVGTPGHVGALIKAHTDAGVPPGLLAMHFHDTYGQALANVYAALLAGIDCFDASAAGIGGCPFAGSSTGNLATEDLLWMLEGLGIESGVDLSAVIEASQRITAILGRPTPSRVSRALAPPPTSSRLAQLTSSRDAS